MADVQSSLEQHQQISAIPVNAESFKVLVREDVVPVNLEVLPLIKLRKKAPVVRPPKKRRQDRCPQWATPS